MCMMPRATPSTMCGWGVQRRCQALLVQRTVQNNSNVKSEPKYLACARISIMCFLLLNSLLFFCRFLGFYSGQTSWVFFLLRVASRRLHSAFVYSLGSAKYVYCKGPAMLFFPSSVAKKHPPDVVM